MARRKKREPMSEGKKNIIIELIEKYDIRTAKDIEDALRDLMVGTIQEMLEAELDAIVHMNARDYRNGKKTKNTWKFRTCLHKNMWIFEHNFVADKAKIRRRAVARQVFLHDMQQNLPGCEDGF